MNKEKKEIRLKKSRKKIIERKKENAKKKFQKSFEKVSGKFKFFQEHIAEMSH